MEYLSINNVTDFIPLVSAFFVFGLGTFIFVGNRNSKINFIFFIFSLTVTIWLFGTFMIFISSSDTWALFWDKFVYIGVIYLMAVIYHFVTEFTEEKNRKIRIILTYILFSIFAGLNIFSKLFIDGIFRYEWGIHAKANIFHHIFLIFFILYSVAVYIMLFKFYKKSKGIKKQQTIYIFVSLLILEAVGFAGFLPAYEISVYPFAFTSGLFFVIITGYAITRNQFLEIKTFAAQFFIVVINIIAFSYIFVSKDTGEYIVKTLFFIGVLFTSYLLKKSFDKEFKQKEKLEKLTKKLERNNEKLKALDRAKNEFISITAHQLRTPPTVIKGYITLAQEDPNNKMDDQTKESLERALISNERLIDLVEDILNVSRIESGNMKYEMKENQLCEDVLVEIYNSFSLRAKDKGIEFILNKPKKPLPRIVMDSKKMKEVVSNLIDNAIKYTREGRVEVTAKKRGNDIRIEVSDSGVGIAKDDMPELFKKFSRGNNPGRLGAEGTGLGIFVGKKIIEDHGGRIWAESDGENKGSTFIIEIPIKSGIKPSSIDDGRKKVEKKRRSKTRELRDFVENI